MKLRNRLSKWYYVEAIGEKYFMAWYAAFVTIPIFGKRFTFIYGLDFQCCDSFKEAKEFLSIQKRVYKMALASKKRR